MEEGGLRGRVEGRLGESGEEWKGGRVSKGKNGRGGLRGRVEEGGAGESGEEWKGGRGSKGKNRRGAGDSREEWKGGGAES